MKSFLGAALALALAAGPAAASVADAYPFIGIWDCGVGEFEFTFDMYFPPHGEHVISEIERESDADFALHLEDGFTVYLAGITDEEMTWISDSSGDQFECVRLR